MSDEYKALQEEAKQFLARCVGFSIAEHKQLGEPEKTSVNESLGLATRLLTGAALNLQAIADAAEREE